MRILNEARRWALCKLYRLERCCMDFTHEKFGWPPDAAFFVCPDEGDDAACGSMPEAPIRTFEEMWRRLGAKRPSRWRVLQWLYKRRWHTVNVHPRGTWSSFPILRVGASIRNLMFDASPALWGGLEPMSHDEVRGLQVGDQLHLTYLVAGAVKFNGLVKVDDVTELDICCEAVDKPGSYFSILLWNPDPHRTDDAWPLDLPPSGGLYEFFKPKAVL